MAREEAKKAEAREDFTRLLRHTKSLTLDSTWEAIKPELETHSAYKDVSLPFLLPFDALVQPASHWLARICISGTIACLVHASVKGCIRVLHAAATEGSR